MHVAELQIREGVLRLIQKLLFLFLNKNIYCDLSLVRSQQDGTNDGSQICFYEEIWRLIIPKLSLLPLLIWSTDVVLFMPTHEHLVSEP